jgi:cAMP-dependent protein kinase regulator
LVFFLRRSRKDDKVAGDEHYTKGQWVQALAAYERVCKRDPENVKVLRRVADLRVKLNRKEKAVEAYRTVADLYARTGFLVQAVAIYKILLRLDPTADDVGQKLAELYAKRGIPTQSKGVERRRLPQIPLFSDLDPEEFAQVVDRLVPRSLAMGEVLFREGDPGDSIFIVTSAAVRVSRGDLVLAELGDGSFFGEGAFFSGEPRNADVVAVAPAELLEIRREDMEALMAKYPGVANAMTEFYRRRVLDGVLADSPLFSRLPGEERKRVADQFRVVPVGPSDVVVSEGDTDRALFIVRRGRFDVSSVPPGGGEPVRLAELGPGSVFGEVALVSRTPRTATVASLEEGEVLRAEGKDLDPLLDDHPDLRRALEQARDERAADTVAKFLGKKG